MRDQFIAGLRVKLIRQSNRHKDSSKVSYQRQPRQQHLPTNSKKLGKCGILGHFARAYRGDSNRRQQQTDLVQDNDGSDMESFATKKKSRRESDLRSCEVT